VNLYCCFLELCWPLLYSNGLNVSKALNSDADAQANLAVKLDGNISGFIQPNLILTFQLNL